MFHFEAIQLLGIPELGQHRIPRSSPGLIPGHYPGAGDGRRQGAPGPLFCGVDQPREVVENRGIIRTQCRDSIDG